VTTHIFHAAEIYTINQDNDCYFYKIYHLERHVTSHIFHAAEIYTINQDGDCYSIKSII
jgi:hypothetical protein